MLVELTHVGELTLIHHNYHSNIQHLDLAGGAGLSGPSLRRNEPRGGQLPDVGVAAEAGRREAAPRCADGRGPRAHLAMGGRVIQTPLSMF